MASIVSICNLALSNIGKENINALSEASAEARACNQFYEHARDLLLQSYPWNFADKTVALAEVVEPTFGKWNHAYQRPADCLKVRWIFPYSGDDQPRIADCDAAKIPFDVDGGLIFANASPAVLVYTARIEDSSQFTPLFVDALSWHLATRLAMPLTRDPKARAEAYQLAQEMTRLAREADANETRTNYQINSALIEGRNHG